MTPQAEALLHELAATATEIRHLYGELTRIQEQLRDLPADSLEPRQVARTNARLRKAMAWARPLTPGDLVGGSGGGGGGGGDR